MWPWYGLVQHFPMHRPLALAPLRCHSSLVILLCSPPFVSMQTLHKISEQARVQRQVRITLSSCVQGPTSWRMGTFMTCEPPPPWSPSSMVPHAVATAPVPLCQHGKISKKEAAAIIRQAEVDLRQLHKKSYVLNQAVSSVSPFKHHAQPSPSAVPHGLCSCRVCCVCCVCGVWWRRSGVGHHGGDRHEQAQGNHSNYCRHYSTFCRHTQRGTTAQ